MADRITLKWGTLKGWSLGNNPDVQALVEEYISEGASMSAMLQEDSDKQRDLICQMIDTLDGEIWNDWDGVIMSKDAAKEYVRNYGRSESAASQ